MDVDTRIDSRDSARVKIAKAKAKMALEQIVIEEANERMAEAKDLMMEAEGELTALGE